jgi:hypothetical protein
MRYDGVACDKVMYGMTDEDYYHKLINNISWKKR